MNQRSRKIRPGAGRAQVQAPAAASGPPATTWAALAARVRGLGIPLNAVLLATLVLLLVNAGRYLFLTDDAFISFRYARNLARGAGLVFNPGFEAVEGYSNFLWVLVLAAFDAIGLAPERMSIVFSLAATVGLWAAVVAFALREAPERGRAWLVAVPALYLAATRSFAMWSTSGLETRFFELLAVCGLFRLVTELEAHLAGRPRRAVAAWLFALATLTRPDGLLLSMSAFGVAGLYLLVKRPAALRAYLMGLLPFVVLIAGHYAFRRLYYGDWLPNTYYAKVGGRTWWSLGTHYLAAFVLEYALWLWIPLVAAAVVRHARRGTTHVPALFAAIVLPHAVYVASIGGDHFEYRPLDLYLPLLFLLLYDGARQLAGPAGARARAAGTAALLALVLVGLWQLPEQSRRQAPAEYLPGFPGQRLQHREGRAFLDPDRDPVYRLPGLRAIAIAHRGLVRELTEHFSAIRHEEHRAFLATVEPEGHRLRGLVAQGVLPADLHVAIACVGAIPYYSELRVLDRLGLTDRTVAHGSFAQKNAIAHDKVASTDYARQRGADLWALQGVHLICNLMSDCMLGVVREATFRPGAYFAAPVGDGDYLLVSFPSGIQRALQRMPNLEFRPISDPAFFAEYLSEAQAAYREHLAAHPDDVDARYELAYLMLAGRDFDGARNAFQALIPERGRSFELWLNLAECYEGLGDSTEAVRVLERAVVAARENGDDWILPGLLQRLQGFGAAAPGTAGR